MGSGRYVDIAVNHDPEAIRMRMVNHPETLHLTEDIFSVDLQKYVNGRHVALMWASPDCTQFSRAKGGKPRLSGIRMLPWAVVKHARAIKPDVIIMENVVEIQQWGPLDEHGRPIKENEGKEYRKFIAALKGMGYKFDSRELNAADYGAPTIRKRWYAIFRRDGLPIIWPTPTHSQTANLYREPWEPAYKYIDYTDTGLSIFGRKKPLADNTCRRIARGIVKFILENPCPFQWSRQADTQSAFLIQYHSESKTGEVRGQELTKPLMTIDTSNRYALVTAFLTKFYKSGTGQSITEPLHTITTSPGHFGLVSAVCGGDQEGGERVAQFLAAYYGTGIGQSITTPLHTIVTKDRFALVSVCGKEHIITDICLRMLRPEELKRCQGFPEDYIIDHDIDGKRITIAQQVAKIGNSVSPPVAAALVAANIKVPVNDSEERRAS